jgi:hypothetical protein
MIRIRTMGVAIFSILVSIFAFKIRSSKLVI